jgi:hypothetical protein
VVRPAGRLATARTKRAGPPPGQGGAPKAETNQRTPAGVFILRTLNGRGARYPEEKARRSRPGFCAVGPRVSHETWVADSARLYLPKSSLAFTTRFKVTLPLPS